MSQIRKTALSLGAFAAVALLAGCRQDMHNEPKFIPQRGTDFFADGRSVRPQVDHTVARGQLDQNEYFYTGLLNGKEQDAMPFPATMTVLEHGQERYNIYCTPCHSRVGNGDGMIVQRGYKPAGNYHDSKRLSEPLSHYFYVMTNGYGAMPDYSEELTPADRWSIAAYIRALQLSQNAKESDVPTGEKVQNLTDIAEQQGLPASFAGPWPIAQNTNVQALPTVGEAAGAPAENPKTPTLTPQPATAAGAKKGETTAPETKK
ncbi:cytochrome c [Alloacidobacterium sp.]|uniref:c-type cytochrome n=1 Tax=Alloacidobacterium sp. TaxID=2951999 RepID=UPI002D4E67BD|nr:cytochrome c [Alloacidobacterium sp.]HYK37569.1 cytochrome c [Alloacidobacterium sp.]